MKKPCRTAETEAVREVLDGNDMYLVKPANPEELAGAIIKLKDNPGLRDKLAENGHNKFKENASHQILGERLLKIINESR